MCECVCVCAFVRECICMCVFGADAHEDQRITMLGCHSSGIVHLMVFFFVETGSLTELKARLAGMVP